ncbi:MAG: aldo/keto reductase [Anaerolineaceae bacterium]|nr:MAG: aldo/keto reductase [Anaerolineaceae bacterium]
MVQVTLGRTGITVNKNGFGALPIQRINKEEAAVLLKKAYSNGIYFYDTARFYTDSEEKIGYALSDVRENIYIATKTMATTPDGFFKDLEISLSNLKTDYIDLYQFHNPSFCPKPGDGTGLYEAMLEAKSKKMIKHIGISNHRLKVAKEAILSGLYETLQYPFSYLVNQQEIELVNLCAENKMGFIAMKALSGGLITNARAAYAYLAQYPNVLPIWGIQKEKELDEFITFINDPPTLDDKLAAIIEADKEELASDFCRGCGYCMPCPVGIDIPNSARMALTIRRSPVDVYINGEWQEKMKRVEECIHCNNCKDNCPYGLDTPTLLMENWEDYKTFI